MARDRMDLTSFVGKLLKEDDSDILRDRIRSLAQMIMAVEVSSKIGAAPTSAPRTAPPIARAIATGPGTRAWAPSSSRSPRSPPAPGRPSGDQVRPA